MRSAFGAGVRRYREAKRKACEEDVATQEASDAISLVHSPLPGAPICGENALSPTPDTEEWQMKSKWSMGTHRVS